MTRPSDDGPESADGRDLPRLRRQVRELERSLKTSQERCSAHERRIALLQAALTTSYRMGAR